MTETAGAWLRHMSSQLSVSRRMASATESRLAPNFCSLTYLRTDEYGLSCVLADLLDPCAAHGQGAVFLVAFLARYWKDAHLDVNQAKVKVESQTDRIENSQRQIDIRVTFGETGVLGIENKAWGAVDQKDQVTDYLADLKTQNEQHHRLIYLTRADGQEPAITSITEDDREQAINGRRLLLLGFPTLIDWLRECIGLCESPRVQAFIGEFIIFIRSELMGIKDMTEHNLIVEAAKSNADHARAALQIVAAGDAIKQALLERFKRNLEDRSATILPTGWAIDTPTGCWGVSIQPRGNPSHCVRLNLERNGGHAYAAIIGVSSTTERSIGLDDVHNALNVIANGKNSAMWPWYLRFEPSRHWKSDIDAMLASMEEGEHSMVEHTIRQFKKIIDVLKDRNLLHRFQHGALGEADR